MDKVKMDRLSPNNDQGLQQTWNWLDPDLEVTFNTDLGSIRHWEVYGPWDEVQGHNVSLA